MNNIAHFTKNKYPLCGADTFFHEVILTKKPKLVDCKVCISILKRTIKPINSMEWSDDTWKEFIK